MWYKYLIKIQFDCKHPAFNNPSFMDIFINSYVDYMAILSNKNIIPFMYWLHYVIRIIIHSLLSLSCWISSTCTFISADNFISKQYHSKSILFGGINNYMHFSWCKRSAQSRCIRSNAKTLSIKFLIKLKFTFLWWRHFSLSLTLFQFELSAHALRILLEWLHCTNIA